MIALVLCYNCILSLHILSLRLESGLAFWLYGFLDYLSLGSKAWFEKRFLTFWLFWLFLWEKSVMIMGWMWCFVCCGSNSLFCLLWLKELKEPKWAISKRKWVKYITYDRPSPISNYGQIDILIPSNWSNYYSSHKELWEFRIFVKN